MFKTHKIPAKSPTHGFVDTANKQGIFKYNELAKSCWKKMMRDLSCMSKIVVELLTVILHNYFFYFSGFHWRQLQIIDIASQHCRFLSFPFIHDKDQSSDELEPLVEVIVGQSMVFRGNRGLLR